MEQHLEQHRGGNMAANPALVMTFSNELVPAPYPQVQ